MHVSKCFHCGYELTGLSPQGNCPECGRAYDLESLTRQARESEPVFVAYVPALGMLLVTLAVFVCGGLMSLVVSNKAAAVATTLVIAACTAFIGFVYAWLGYKQRRGE